MAYGNYTDYRPFHHPSRLRERARKLQNPLQEMGLLTDGKVTQLQRQLRQAQYLPDLTPEIETHRARMQRTLKENKFNGTTTWIDYYRLHAHRDLLEQLTYAPVIFERHNIAGNEAYQEAIVSEVYPLNMSLLKSEIQEHDHPDARHIEKQNLRGIIQEHTAAALLNHAQSPYHLTLPAATISDLAHRTDLVHHTVVSGQHKAINIQMKSEKSDETTDPYFGGITITSQDFGNSYADNLRTTRTLLRQFSGNADEDDYVYLATMQRRLFNKIDEYHASDSEAIAA